eukprot:TRINITY_DN5806_c0_g1_i4.p1 TRINITY_DN5806_c0_g1~~TRINITY_DN5806_c0_g1_i4.p1  ORF type:complete len:208 (-),score=5.75 TRINITY_DN5806_c0_g1_i4:171-794(-)
MLENFVFFRKKSVNFAFQQLKKYNYDSNLYQHSFLAGAFLPVPAQIQEIFIMSSQFTKYLEKDSVVVLEGKNKKEIIDELVAIAAVKSNLDTELIRELTWKREKMMTTGVGEGLALPHIRIDGIGTPVIICGLCKSPVQDYNTPDGKPVQVIMYLMGSTSNQNVYLEILGSISRKLRVPGIIEDILENITRPSQVMRILKRLSLIHI